MDRNAKFYREAKNRIRRYLPEALRRKLPRHIAIVSVSVAESRHLNRAYRKKNQSTNILSFRYGPRRGEIILCSAIIRREAKLQGNTFSYQRMWMILHGLVHLAGLHHEASGRAQKRTERLEKKILAKMGYN